jgi:ABC-2 type transport system ATP-binding protein
VSRFHSSDGRAKDRANMMHGTAPAPAVALAVEGISYSYGPRQALADVTFSIAPATFAVLLGLNGAGKTTLFSLITRLYGTQRGQISILGHDVARTPGDALRLIGVVFQSRTLDLDLSVMQNLIYHAALHGIGRRAARRRAREMLDQIDPQSLRRPDAPRRDCACPVASAAPARARRTDRRP